MAVKCAAGQHARPNLRVFVMLFGDVARVVDSSVNARAVSYTGMGNLRNRSVVELSARIGHTTWAALASAKRGASGHRGFLPARPTRGHRTATGPIWATTAGNPVVKVAAEATGWELGIG